MGTRTLNNFCEENNISLEDIAEKSGISLGTLRYADKTNTLPSNIGAKIAAAYGLPESYFSEDIYLSESAPAKRDFWYFVKFGFEWAISIEAAIGVFGLLFIYLNSAAESFINPQITRPISAIVFSAAAATVAAVLCNTFAKHFERSNAITGNFRKYRFLYYVLPANAAMMLRVIPAAAAYFFEENIFIDKGVSVAILLAVFWLTASFMNDAYNSEKDTKSTVRTLVILGLISWLITEPLATYFTAADSYSVSWIPVIANGASFAALALGLTVGAKKKPELEKLWYAVLPIVQIAISILTSFSAIDNYLLDYLF